MKVKIPKEVKIAGRTYTIKFNSELLRDEGNRGIACYSKQEIQLYSGLAPEQRVVTFIHEYIHTIDEHLCGRAALSEEVTSGLAEGIFQLLKDNLNIEFDWGNIPTK